MFIGAGPSVGGLAVACLLAIAPVSVACRCGPRAGPAPGRLDVPPAAAAGISPARQVPASAELEVRLHRASPGEAPVAATSVALEFWNFYVHAGMGVVSVYARGIAVTDNRGSFSVRVPMPRHGALSAVTIQVMRREPSAPPPFPSVTSDLKGAFDGPPPPTDARGPAAAEAPQGNAAFRLHVGGGRPRSGVVRWEAAGPRPRAHYACAWRLADASGE